MPAGFVPGAFRRTAVKTTVRTGLNRGRFQAQASKRSPLATDPKRSPASSGFGQPVIGEPAAELLRCTDVILENGGVDLEATNPIGVARQAKPHVLDPQHSRTLSVGDRVTQCLMPSRDVLVKIVQPQREVQPPRTSRTLEHEWEVISLVSDLSRRAPVSAFVPIVEADYPVSSMSLEINFRTSGGW
jgi:hypothetical protein